MLEFWNIPTTRIIYSLVGFTLVSLVITFSGQWQSNMENKSNMNTVYSRALIKRKLTSARQHLASQSLLNSIEKAGTIQETMLQYEKNSSPGEGLDILDPIQIDGSFRNNEEGAPERGMMMLLHRTHDNYTHCVKTAPFVGPFLYIENSKNPCWYDDDLLRCIPYYYIAGFSKSGTTDLYGRLSRHPQIPLVVKERHWLDYSRYFKGGDTIEKYSDMFQPSTKIIKKDLDIHGSSRIITGDNTPCYASFNYYWRCYEGNQGMEQPKYTNADVIYQLNPKAKIIFMLRDPASRLYSRYLTWIGKHTHIAYREPSPSAFHSLVTNAVTLFNKCVERWSVRHCAYNGTLYTQSTLRLVEGMYSVFLRDWLKVFPRNQLLILRFEDYVSDMSIILRKVFQFLNIDQLSSEKMKAIKRQKKRNVGRHYNIGMMLNSTRAILEDFYSQFNKVLPSLLDDNSMKWDYN